MRWLRMVAGGVVSLSVCMYVCIRVVFLLCQGQREELGEMEESAVTEKCGGPTAACSAGVSNISTSLVSDGPGAVVAGVAGGAPCSGSTGTAFAGWNSSIWGGVPAGRFAAASAAGEAWGGRSDIVYIGEKRNWNDIWCTGYAMAELWMWDEL
jgi:hypothetical protein